MFVLDTNTVIYFFRGQGNISHHLLATPPSEIAIPAIVQYELLVGAAKSQNPETRIEQLARFFSSLTILPFGPAEASQATNARVELENGGKPIGPYDILIAATTLSVGGILVSRNTREFGRVNGLKLIDWFTDGD